MRNVNVIRRAACALLLVASLGLGACVAPAVQRSLLDAGLPAVSRAPKHVRVQIDVVDARPMDELLAKGTDVEYVVPLGLMFFWAKEGNLLPDSSLYSPNTPGELATLVQRALASAGMEAQGDPSAPLVRVKITLRHLYGTSHASSSWFIGAGGGAVSTRTFGAYGYAAADIELMDEAGNPLGRRSLIGQHSPGAVDVVNSERFASNSITDLLTRAAVTAASNLAARVPAAVESMLEAYPNKRRVDPTKTSVFFISRFTSDGRFVETAGISVGTGEIVSNDVRKTAMVPYAASNQWMVDPYHGGTTRLAPADYRALIGRLRTAGYEVAYVDNVRVAHFLGVRPASTARRDRAPGRAPSVAPAASEPPQPGTGQPTTAESMPSAAGAGAAAPAGAPVDAQQ